MKVLVACEFSGRVRSEFEKLGHDAVSCDLLPTEIPGNHYEGDIMDILHVEHWDMMIAHPPCTYLSTAGNRVWNVPGRAELREAAYRFVMTLAEADIPRICIENPVGYLNSAWRKPDQIIHPYYFGEPVLKRTCLWLKDLPPLMATGITNYPRPVKLGSGGRRVNFTEACSGSDRAKARSRTFHGIAAAMALQWGGS